MRGKSDIHSTWIQKKVKRYLRLWQLQYKRILSAETHSSEHEFMSNHVVENCLLAWAMLIIQCCRTSWKMYCRELHQFFQTVIQESCPCL
mmetsp:Transcript_3481/g.21873  ORF Transcript_3481/g.21873 Transcript_3481/m.21873 type:complete len:90 (+) Transcript_3481:1842-2111(+)